MLHRDETSPRQGEGHEEQGRMQQQGRSRRRGWREGAGRVCGRTNGLLLLLCRGHRRVSPAHDHAARVSDGVRHVQIRLDPSPPQLGHDASPPRRDVRRIFQLRCRLLSHFCYYICFKMMHLVENRSKCQRLDC